MHHLIIYYNDPSIEGISLVHNKYGNLVSRECYIHIRMDASPYGIGDSSHNFSGKHQKDKEQIFKVILNTIKISLQGKFGHSNSDFIKTKFWKRKRHIEASHFKIRNMVTTILIIGVFSVTEHHLILPKSKKNGSSTITTLFIKTTSLYFLCPETGSVTPTSYPVKPNQGSGKD